MLKRFLVAHDDSLTDWEPAFVDAMSNEEAIEHYLKTVYSKDSVFREHVQDLRNVDAFVGSLVFSTADEKIDFMNGHRLRSPEFIQSRISNFFAEEPSLGETFWKYLTTEDPSVIDDETYEFVAAKSPEGVIAIEASAIRLLKPTASAAQMARLRARR
jgi:hypothetical protein